MRWLDAANWHGKPLGCAPGGGSERTEWSACSWVTYCSAQTPPAVPVSAAVAD